MIQVNSSYILFKLSKFKRLSFLIAMLLGFPSIQAQEVLSVEEAIRIALEKNYSVLSSKNLVEITKVQNNFGNAGMSPTVSATGSYNLSDLNSYQEFATGAVQERLGAKSNGLGASLNVSWTVFDGLKMFAVKKRLDINENLSALELKKQLENTIYSVIVAYYDIVRTKELIKAENQNLTIYSERKKIAQLKYDIGSASKVDLLLSQTDESKAQSALIQLDLNLLQAKTALNTLLNRSADIDFITSDSIVVFYDPDLNDLKKSSLQNNTGILVSRQVEQSYLQSIKEARSSNIPFLQVNASYLMNQSKNEAGFLSVNRQSGFNAGLTANWLIFNGNKNRKLVQERQILALNQRLITEQTMQVVDALTYISYQKFQLNKQMVKMERQNLLNTKEVMDISVERYRSGKADLMETIISQKYLEDSQVRYINALYAMKIAETDLLRVNGSLVK